MRNCARSDLLLYGRAQPRLQVESLHKEEEMPGALDRESNESNTMITNCDLELVTQGYFSSLSKNTGSLGPILSAGFKFCAFGWLFYLLVLYVFSCEQYKIAYQSPFFLLISPHCSHSDPV